MNSEENSLHDPAGPVVVYAEALANRGGTGVYLRRLLKGLSELDPNVLAAARGKIMKAEEALLFASLSRGPLKVLAEHLILPAAAAALSPSLVHLPAFSGRPPRGVPFVLTVHDLAFLRNPSWFPRLRSLYYSLLFGRTARKADVVMVDSDFTAREARLLLGIDSSRLRRVYLCTEPFGSDPVPFRRAFSVNGRYIAYAGTVEPRKNISALLDSWASVRRHHRDLTLVIAGRWGWGPPSLRRRLDTTEGVLYTGSLSHEMLMSCISGASLLVYPSLYEGFGLPPLEAASAGVPSVVSPADALREVYSGVSFVAGGFDAESISDAVLGCIDTQPDRRRLREFASSFSPRRMAAEVLEVYGEFRQ